MEGESSAPPNKRRKVPGTREAEQAALSSVLQKLARKDAGEGRLMVDRALSSLPVERAAGGAHKGSAGKKKR